MNHPIIGISGSHNVADRQMFVRENYMQSVLRAGGIPVLLPEVEDEATAKAMIDHLDGLLLAGGGRRFAVADTEKRSFQLVAKMIRSAISSSF